MKLYQLLEDTNELGFDSKYTREDNPEPYTSSLNVINKNLSSFERIS